MARDAIARQYDVDKNLITLTCEPGKESYRPGLITFFPKKGKALDLDKMRASLAASRLSGGTSMRVDYLELTVRGTVVMRSRDNKNDLLLRASGIDQEFVLGEEPSAKAAWGRLGNALVAPDGKSPTTVTGRVAGWDGRFPDVLRNLETDQGKGAPLVLRVTDFTVGPDAP